VLFFNTDAISKVNKDYHNFQTLTRRRFHSTTVLSFIGL